MENTFTVTPSSYQKLLKLQEGSSYSLAQLVDIAIDYYFDDCKEVEEAIKERKDDVIIPMEEVIKEAGCVRCK